MDKKQCFTCILNTVCYNSTCFATLLQHFLSSLSRRHTIIQVHSNNVYVMVFSCMFKPNCAAAAAPLCCFHACLRCFCCDVVYPISNHSTNHGENQKKQKKNKTKQKKQKKQKKKKKKPKKPKKTKKQKKTKKPYANKLCLVLYT